MEISHQKVTSLLHYFGYLATFYSQKAMDNTGLFTCNVTGIVSVKATVKVCIVPMVTDTLTGRMGCTLILSIKVSVKKIKDTVHKKSKALQQVYIVDLCDFAHFQNCLLYTFAYHCRDSEELTCCLDNGLCK